MDLVLQVKPLGLELTDNLDLGLVLHHLWISDHEDFSLMHLYLLPVLLDLDLMDNLDLPANLALLDNLALRDNLALVDLMEYLMQDNLVYLNNLDKRLLQ